MLQYVVQIIVRGSDDAIDDTWHDICINLVPDDDSIHRVIKLFDRVGYPLAKHVLCWPNETSTRDGVTEEELSVMRDFDPSKYKMYEPKPDKICIIKGRYMLKMD